MALVPHGAKSPLTPARASEGDKADPIEDPGTVAAVAIVASPKNALVKTPQRRVEIKGRSKLTSFLSAEQVSAAIAKTRAENVVVEQTKIAGFNWAEGLIIDAKQTVTVDPMDPKKVTHARKYVIKIRRLGAADDMPEAIGTWCPTDGTHPDALKLVKRRQYREIQLQYNIQSGTKVTPSQWVPPIGQREYKTLSVGENAKFTAWGKGSLWPAGTEVRVADIVTSAYKPKAKPADLIGGGGPADAAAAAAMAPLHHDDDEDSSLMGEIRHSFAGKILVLKALQPGETYDRMVHNLSPLARLVPNPIDEYVRCVVESRMSGKPAVSRGKMSFTLCVGGTEKDFYNALQSETEDPVSFVRLVLPLGTDESVTETMISFKDRNAVVHSTLVCYFQGVQKAPDNSFIFCGDINIREEHIAALLGTCNLEKWKMAYRVIPLFPRFFAMCSVDPFACISTYPRNAAVAEAKIKALVNAAMNVDENGDVLLDMDEEDEDAVPTYDDMNSFKMGPVWVDKILIVPETLVSLTIAVSLEQMKKLPNCFIPEDQQQKDAKTSGQIICLSEVGLAQAEAKCSAKDFTDGKVRALILSPDDSFWPEQMGVITANTTVAEQQEFFGVITSTNSNAELPEKYKDAPFSLPKNRMFARQDKFHFILYRIDADAEQTGQKRELDQPENSGTAKSRVSDEYL